MDWKNRVTDKDEALSLNDDDVVAALGWVPENKRHCSLLGINALHAAVADFLRKSEADDVRKVDETS